MVRVHTDGTTITTDKFGLTIDGRTILYPQSPNSRFISTDGTQLEIGDNSSTQNHNRIQVVGDIMELVLIQKRVELGSGSY